MIFSSQSPVTFNDPLPGAVDIVVIGAGVIGISTAWFLATAGLRVVVCDKGRVAGEQSSRNWGWVRQQGRDEAELPIMMESNQIWQSFATKLREDTGFRQHGVMYIGETDKEMEKFTAWVELAKKYDLESNLLTPQQIASQIRGIEGSWKGGVVTPSDGRAEPFVAVPVLARDCQAKGVAIVENCAVRSVVQQAGRVSGVVTEQGEVGCQSVVCAGGAWSSLFLANVGAGFPQLSVKSTVARTAATNEFYPGNVASEDFALRRRLDGGYTIAPGDISEHPVCRDSFKYCRKFLPLLIESWGETRIRFGKDAPGGMLPPKQWRDDEVTPFEKQRVLNPTPTQSVVQELGDRLGRRFPSLRNLPIAEVWCGMIDTTPDVVPVMDYVESIPGLLVASGFSGHGFGIGPGAGRVMADLVQGNQPGHDLSRFRLSRFSDGSKIVAGPSL